MFSSRELIVGAALCVAAASANAERYPGIGRAATPEEVAAWDIDVRPDFKGLPPGSGSVAQGQRLYDERCASCHGAFAESNEYAQPLVGGTSEADVRSGRVARLADTSYPLRTAMMKLPTLSTLWDFINRAMPWDDPKSLKPDDVYALTAYLLHMSGVVGADFTLNERNVAGVQQRMPNRNGMTREHGLWPGVGKPDVKARACMKDCGPVSQIASSLPESQSGAHGNLAEQHRRFGAPR